MTITALTAALDAHKPSLAAHFATFAERRFAALVKQFGPSLRGVYNSTQYRNWTAIASLTTTNGDRVNSGYLLVADRVAAAAAQFADATVATWADKIAAKLGELDGAEVRHLDGYRFAVVGTKGDRTIRIEQDMIINVSVKGTLFNQFPSRIYVDGKFTSAANYAKL
jgi:hypothetical protein